MSRVPLTLPPQAKVIGSLRDRSRLHNLDQDMLTIELPGDIFIDVGWYPDWNPQGEYRLVVYRETFENQIEYPIKTNNVTAIKVAIEQMAKKYSPAVRFMGGDSLVTTLFVDDCNVDSRFRVAV